MNKFLIALFSLIGLAGIGIGIYASIDPKGVMTVMSGIDGDQMGLWIGIGVPVFFLLVFGMAFSPFIKMAMKNSQKKKQLKMTGIRGVAKVVSVSDTGMTVNDNPYVKIVVEMNGKTAEFSTTVSRISIPRAGDSMNVLYDPADPSTMIPA